MSRKYISTAIVGDAHKSDIFGVSITNDYTVTCSADGHLKLWQNGKSGRDLQLDQFVDKTGLHHVSTLEVTVDDNKREIIVLTVAFSGKLYAYSYDEGGLVSLEDKLPKELTNSKTSFWACQLEASTTDDSHMLAITAISGHTHVAELRFYGEEDEPDADQVYPRFRYLGSAFANDNSLATSVDIDTEQRRLAVGHQNGTVYLYDLEYLKLLYNFESFGLKSNTSSSSLSTVRCIQFSPDGKLLAVARDSGPYGTVTIYDVLYGETVGSLTMPTHSASVGVGSYAHNNWCLSVSFNEDGQLIATGGLDNKVRIWNVETRESEAVLTMSSTDVSDEVLENSNNLDNASCCSLSFIPKGFNTSEGSNDGIVIVGCDRAIRWFREAGGI